MNLKHLLLLGLSVLPVTTLYAATIDGVIDTNSGAEYQWDTKGAEGSDKWHTRGGNKEFDDASGGDNYDINYLGVNVENNQYQLGIVGGKVLEGNAPYHGHDYFLSDIAINVVTPGEIVTDPTLDSTGWDYALRLVNINDGAAIIAGTQAAVFDLYALGGGSWDRTGITEGTPHAYSSTDTFKMSNGDLVEEGIAGLFTNNGADDNVLEVSFDLGLLGLFDAIMGGEIITYLTIACVNDEALVHAEVLPVPPPVPVPAAFWLFGSALIGFIGFSRRTSV